MQTEVFQSALPKHDESRWVRAEDSWQVMQPIQVNSASLVATDPPYFINGMGDDWDHTAFARRMRGCRVVKSLPIGIKFDQSQGLRLQEFMHPIAVEWLRIARPGGFELYFSQNRSVHHAAMAIETAGFEIRDILAWRYEGQAKAFSQDHIIRRRMIPQKEKDRLIGKLAGRMTPKLKPQCKIIVLAQAPRDGTFVDNWDQWEPG